MIKKEYILQVRYPFIDRGRLLMGDEEMNQVVVGV